LIVLSPSGRRALGRSKGGMTTEIHTTVDALGNPVRFILTPGRASDYNQGAALIECFPAQNFLGEKRYDGDDLIEKIEAAGAQVVMPPKSAGKRRETAFVVRLNQYRGIATRYCKLARSFATFIFSPPPYYLFSGFSRNQGTRYMQTRSKLSRCAHNRFFP